MRRTPLKRKRRKRRTKAQLAKANANPRSKDWRDRCDKLWAYLVKARDGGCVICRDERCEAHHLIGCRRVFFRHNLLNGVALCGKHHRLCAKLSAHGAPWAFEAWMGAFRPMQFPWWKKNRNRVIEGASINYKQVADGLMMQAALCDPAVDLPENIAAMLASAGEGDDNRPL